MEQIISSNWFSGLRDAFEFWDIVSRYIAEFFDSLPSTVRSLFFIILITAVIGILLSHAIAIHKNFREWKPKAGSNLMFSYFCGSGAFQRKKIYQDAHKLLRDRTWSWISFAGLAYRLGNYRHESTMLMFACSLIYLPVAVMGFIEMVLRDIIGTIWLLGSGLAHRLILFVLLWISYLLIPLWALADRIARVGQHCPHCYAAFDLPGFKCPSCGTIHKQLIPSRCGILVARCECGKFMSSTVFTGRSNVDAVCPKCEGSLAATNAKQFSIQLIGGNTSGKTAFLAAFQHMYIENSIGAKKLSIYGEPHDEFEKLEAMFKNGVTEPSSSEAAMTYNLVHRFGRDARNNLVIFDIPDEVILSGDYQRNPLNFGYSDGILIMVDPLSIQAVREECLKAGDAKAVEGYSLDDVETIIIRFIHQFSEIVGRSARKMIHTPVAILISKADVKVIKREIGLPKIKAKYNANPASFQDDFSVARDEVCRKYLLDLGLTNALNNLESVFSDVHYFPVSSIGHLSESGKPFEPIGVMEPMTWIAKKAKSGIFALLKDTQDLVTADNFQDEATARLMSERYRQAEELLASKQYDAATKAFVVLGAYRDAAKRADEVKEIRYKQASTLLSEKRYDDAIKEFSALSSYKDARVRVSQSRYQKAEMLLAESQFQEALSLFRGLGEYKDAPARVVETRYMEAEALLAEEDYIGALAIFSDLGTYKDAPKKAASLLPGLIKQGQKSGLSFGPYKWRVLTMEGNKALLITESILDKCAYNDCRTETTWENCTLRHYLNGAFYDRFNAKEKAMIVSVRLMLHANDQHGTADNVFLLSINEMERYFSDDGNRVSLNEKKDATWWWLRSPGGNSFYAAIVDAKGKVSDGGNWVDNTSGGIRPALWLNL